MSDSARVDSIDALKRFRVALCKFGEAVQAGLDEADVDIKRTQLWLAGQQRGYWKRQIHLWGERVTRARSELTNKQHTLSQLGHRPSCVDEKKALAAAKARLERSEHKLAEVQRWIRRLDQELFNYKAAVQGLAHSVQIDVPGALAHLDNMVTALESYAAVQPGGETPGARASATTTPVERGPGEQRTVEYSALRGQSPPAAVRGELAVQSSRMAWGKSRRLLDAQESILRELGIDPEPVEEGDRVVLAAGMWKHPRIFLERSSATLPGDSGWYIGMVDAAPQQFEAWSARDLLSRTNFDIIMQLPKGYLVIIDGSALEAVVDPTGAVAWSRTTAGPKGGET